MARRKKQKRTRKGRQDPPAMLRVEREQVFRLDVDESGCLMGSDPACDLRLSHRKVAQRQGVLVWQDGVGVYRDFGETPGVAVFGADGLKKNLEPECTVASGDRIVLGSLTAIAEIEVTSFLRGVLWATVREVVHACIEISGRTITVGSKDTCSLVLEADYIRPLSGRFVRMHSGEWAYEDMGAGASSLLQDGTKQVLEAYRMHRLSAHERLVIGAPSDRLIFGLWDSKSDVWLGSRTRRPRAEGKASAPPPPHTPPPDPPSRATWSRSQPSEVSAGDQWTEEKHGEYSRIERYVCLIHTAIAIARAQGSLTSAAVVAVRDGLEHILGGLSDSERGDVRAAMKSTAENDLDDDVRKLTTLEMDQGEILSFLVHVATLSGEVNMDAYRILKRVGFVFSAKQEWRDVCARLGVLRQYSLDVLGLREDAPAVDMKRAYRAMVGQFHPDRFVNADEQTRAMANDKTREINEAYAFLSKKN